MKRVPPNRPPVLPIGSTIEGNQLVTLTGAEFARHKHIIGVSGSGKSSFLASIALFLLRLEVPFLLIDPHGDLAKLILSLLSESDFFRDPRAYDRLWYVDFARPDAAIAFNVLKQDASSHTIAANTLEAIHRAFPSNTTTASMDNVILASILALCENGLPLTALNRFLLDAPFRSRLVETVSDPLVTRFLKEKLDGKSSQMADSTLRRSFLLTFSPILRGILGQMENKLDFSDLMNRKNTSCLFNLGGLDDHTKRLLGCLLMVSIEHAFLARASLPADSRTPCHVIVDEFPLFSASEQSFAVVLEQVRKYKGTLYLAHQTTSQLTKGIAGSLQNALSIVMKLGYEDSTWAAQRFARPEETSPESFTDLFWDAPSKISGPFDGMTRLQQIKECFETLSQQEAIVTLNTKSLFIKTPTLPSVATTSRRLVQIEDEYAARLLTPVSIIERAHTKANLTVVHSVTAPGIRDFPQRRSPVRDTDKREPFRFLTGVLETDILTALFHFHYLTLAQVARLLQKETSTNYLRSKLKTFSEGKLVEPIPLARNSPGKPPIVYTLTSKGVKYLAREQGIPPMPPTGVKKHGFLEHTLAVNEVLIQAALLPIVEPTITLIDLKHERTLKNTPIRVGNGAFLVPDGFVHLRQGSDDMGICFEIDRNTEDREKIQGKIRNYLAAAQGPYQQVFGLESLTVAFCVTEGGDQRVKQLVTWAEQALATSKDAAGLFLFAALEPASLEPHQFFLDMLFIVPGNPSYYSLIGKIRN